MSASISGSHPPTPPHIVLANDRRLRLVEQKYRRGPSGGLTADEQAELNECARVVGEWIEKSACMAGRRDGTPLPD